MEIINRKTKELSLAGEIEHSQVSRRKFLRAAGIFGVAATVVGTGCSRSGDDFVDNGGVVDLGSGDFGILNYAYALEQLEAAFYIQATASPFAGITATETAYLQDIRDHEIAHREFFKNALGTNAIKALEVDFSSINFGSRDSVLGTAKAFEDLGVSAYNGAGRLLVSGDYLLIAGKIVSVEARHAALIRDLITPNSFAASDVVDAMGLDVSRTPPQVLAIAKTYIKTQLDASKLPA
ncbi:MAG: ferritin-like domain-containing protein [Bacteroidota bacterium]